MLRLLFILIFTVFSLSYSAQEGDVKHLFKRLNIISADVFLYKKIDRVKVLTVGKYDRVLTFIFTDKDIHVYEGFPEIKGKKIEIGKHVFDIRKKRSLEKIEKKMFEILKKENYEFLYLKNKRKLRFKAERIKLIKLENNFFLIAKRGNKLEVHYLIPKSYFPRLIKRISIRPDYGFETVKCREKFFLILFPEEYGKPAFIYSFSGKKRRLIEKLMVKNWRYEVTACYEKGIVLSDGIGFFVLSMDGSIEKPKRVRINDINLSEREVEIGRDFRLFILDNYLIVEREKSLEVFDSKLNSSSAEISGFESFKQIGSDIYAVKRENSDLCLYRIEKNPLKLFCKEISESDYYIKKVGIYIFDRKKQTVYLYSFRGDLLLKEKVLKNREIKITDDGIFYTDGFLTRIKPNGDYEIYDIKPKKLVVYEDKLLIYTKRGRFLFYRGTFKRLKENCEPFMDGFVCSDTVYRFKDFIFPERPICRFKRNVVSVERVDSEMYLKVFSLNDKQIKGLKNISDTNGFSCFKEGVVLIRTNGFSLISDNP